MQYNKQKNLKFRRNKIYNDAIVVLKGVGKNEEQEESLA